MKKLVILAAALMAFAGCAKDEVTDGQSVQTKTDYVPHFYGAAMLENPAPQTRGVAQDTKVWSKPMAEKNLTVKFLNGTAHYQQMVKDIVKEWEKAAGVRFYFVGSDKDALIRVGFDYVPGMQSSWAYTGTDHLQLYDKQSEPTVHFARWRRIADVLKRSDVLRAFGQVLGLELEFRHPNFHPGWITNADGSIDTAAIRDYWEYELADAITWEELKKVVLDPLADNSFFISKTAAYDSLSVMNWPFYEMIAQNLPLIDGDKDHRSELSAQDKAFIKELYGESFNGLPDENDYLPIVQFNYKGTAPKFSLTTTKNLVVIWDKEAKKATRLDLPVGATELEATLDDFRYAESKTRKIIIGELLEYGQEMPQESHALLKFDLTTGSDADSIDIMPLNKALEYVRINGGHSFSNHNFDFTGYGNLKELYLVETHDSRLTVDGCTKLLTLATSPYIWKPASATGPLTTTVADTPVNGVYPLISSPTALWPDDGLIADTALKAVQWPEVPEPYHSLSERYGKALTINNCPNIKEISLENTRVTKVDFSGFSDLEYVYLSSTHEYIIGGSEPYASKRNSYLVDAINSLPNRPKENPGLIVLRGISSPTGRIHNRYAAIVITRSDLQKINTALTNKNWRAFWDSGLVVPVNPLDE